MQASLPRNSCTCNRRTWIQYESQRDTDKLILKFMWIRNEELNVWGSGGRTAKSEELSCTVSTRRHMALSSVACFGDRSGVWTNGTDSGVETSRSLGNCNQSCAHAVLPPSCGWRNENVYTETVSQCLELPAGPSLDVAMHVNGRLTDGSTSSCGRPSGSECTSRRCSSEAPGKKPPNWGAV